MSHLRQLPGKTLIETQLEDLQVFEKPRPKKSTVLWYWFAGWRIPGKKTPIERYLGPSRQGKKPLTREEALAKARSLKARDLGLSVGKPFVGKNKKEHFKHLSEAYNICNFGKNAIILMYKTTVKKGQIQGTVHYNFYFPGKEEIAKSELDEVGRRWFKGYMKDHNLKELQLTLINQYASTTEVENAIRKSDWVLTPIDLLINNYKRPSELSVGKL